MHIKFRKEELNEDKAQESVQWKPTRQVDNPAKQDGP